MLSTISYLVRVTPFYQPATLETVCLQIRKILELVAFGSLVANKEAYTATYAKVSRAWNAGEILAELSKVNPNFYPVPVIEVPSEIPGVQSQHKKRVGDYLDEEEFKEVYGRCGALAHAANPYGKGIDYEYYARSLPIWQTRIMNLLNAHDIHLLGDPGMYVVHMSEQGDDRVKLYRFRPAVIGPSPKSWFRRRPDRDQPNDPASNRATDQDFATTMTRRTDGGPFKPGFGLSGAVSLLDGATRGRRVSSPRQRRKRDSEHKGTSRETEHSKISQHSRIEISRHQTCFVRV
jgi:hypothetical protein